MSDVPASGIWRRLDRLQARSVRGGLLTVEEAAALASVGFEPVSEVIGAVATNVVPYGFYSAGAVPFQQQHYYNQPVNSGWTPNYFEAKTYTSSDHSRVVGTPNSILALKDGYGTALSRLEAEARAVGADGVVDVRLTRTVTHGSGAQLWSFLAVGTAVRGIGARHAESPFMSDLSAAQTAAALRGGWLPVSVLVVPVMGIRYVGWPNRGRLAPNAEMVGISHAVNDTRRQARTDLEARARAVHADGAVMSSMSMEVEARSGEQTCTVSVIITGTALARFKSAPGRPAPLMIMPLNKGKS